MVTVQGIKLEVVEAAAPGGGKTLVLSGTTLMELGSDTWSLVPDSGPEKGQVIPVMERLEIGRALDCDISILEPSLSRKHAERHLIGDDLVVRDLGSVNDTWVNAEKIDEEVKLKDSDVLQFERIKLIVSSPT